MGSAVPLVVTRRLTTKCNLMNNGILRIRRLTTNSSCAMSTVANSNNGERLTSNAANAAAVCISAIGGGALLFMASNCNKEEEEESRQKVIKQLTPFETNDIPHIENNGSSFFLPNKINLLNRECCHCEPSSSTNSITQQNELLKRQYTKLNLLTNSTTLCESPSNNAGLTRNQLLKRKFTARLNRESITSPSILEAKYDIHWSGKPLGVGASGKVYLGHKRHPNNNKHPTVAIKKINQINSDDDETFRREMTALLDIRAAGGHPNICGLIEHYSVNIHRQPTYILVLDHIAGGELFDSLMNDGGYSEADAARLVREVASALNFLHGIGVVHGDLKPENLMLSTKRRMDAVVKLVDFGSAEKIHIEEEEDDEDFVQEDDRSTASFTPAYCPPEVLVQSSNRVSSSTPKPPQDMWALGVILYIMLTGVHPYDLTGTASERTIQQRILNPRKYKVPLSHKSPYTRHLSPSALDLIYKLMDRKPENRYTAHQMLNHPWVRGETASTNVIIGSDQRLRWKKENMVKSDDDDDDSSDSSSMDEDYDISIRSDEDMVQRTFFENAIQWSDDDDETRRRSDLIERSYGYHQQQDNNNSNNDETQNQQPQHTLTMSDFSNVLSTNMSSLYYPKNHCIYSQGDEGNYMYFINSGKVRVTTDDDSRFYATRNQGDFFGEGALLNPTTTRSATVTTLTPVHVIRIDRKYFKKFMDRKKQSNTKGDSIFLQVSEKDKIRKKNRAKVVLRLQPNLQEMRLKEGDVIFQHGDDGDSLFIVDEGSVDVVSPNDKKIFSVYSGNVFGENSLLTGRKRNSVAYCTNPQGCILQNLKGDDFRKVAQESPNVKESLQDLCRRRDFKKAIVKRMNVDFPYANPRLAFDAVDSKNMGYLDFETIAVLLREFDESYKDDEVRMVLKACDLTKSGRIEFEEFQKVFVADINKSASM